MPGTESFGTLEEKWDFVRKVPFFKNIIINLSYHLYMLQSIL